MQTCMSKNVVNCNSVTVELPIYKIDISSKYLRWMLRKIAHFHLLSYDVAANCPFKQIVLKK